METLGSRLKQAMKARGVSAQAIADANVMSRANVYLWLNNTTDPTKSWDGTGKKLCKFLKINREWLLYGKGQMDASDDAAQSQVVGFDVARLGPALTAMDRVIRGRGRPVEGQLGKYPGLFLYAYELQEDEKLFPNGITATSPKRELKRYDKLLDEYLGGMIADEEAEKT